MTHPPEAKPPKKKRASTAGTRTSVSVELAGEDFERMKAIQKRMGGESFPSILRSFAFAYDALQEKAAASLVDGASDTPEGMELRLSRQINEMHKEQMQLRRELNATAALLDSFAKLVLGYLPAPPQQDRAAFIAETRDRFEKVMLTTVSRFDGDTAKVLGDIEDRVVRARYPTGAKN